MIILRIILSPLIFVLVLIYTTILSLVSAIRFIIHGGEFILLYKNDKKTIQDLYEVLKSSNLSSLNNQEKKE